MIVIASLSDTGQTNRLQANATERKSVDRVIGVICQHLSDVLACFGCEVVSVEHQLCDVLTVLFFEDGHEVQRSQVCQIITVDF